MVNDRVEIKPSTRHDLNAFCGNKMRDSCKAWSAFYDGKLVAIGGVAITRNLMLVFMEMRLNEDVSDRIIWCSSKKIWDKIKSLGYLTLYAEANNKLSSASRFLEHLGFEQIGFDENRKIFRWQTQ